VTACTESKPLLVGENSPLSSFRASSFPALSDQTWPESSFIEQGLQDSLEPLFHLARSTSVPVATNSLR
jgi:hypothetical protein